MNTHVHSHVAVWKEEQASNSIPNVQTADYVQRNVKSNIYRLCRSIPYVLVVRIDPLDTHSRKRSQKPHPTKKKKAKNRKRKR